MSKIEGLAYCKAMRMNEKQRMELSYSSLGRKIYQLFTIIITYIKTAC